jgi:hypothetical protein
MNTRSKSDTSTYRQCTAGSMVPMDNNSMDTFYYNHRIQPLLQAYGQLVHDHMAHGWHGYLLSFMFCQIPGSDVSKMLEMKTHLGWFPAPSPASCVSTEAAVAAKLVICGVAHSRTLLRIGDILRSLEIMSAAYSFQHTAQNNTRGVRRRTRF